MNNKFLGKVVQTEEVLPVEPDIKPTEGYQYDIGVGDMLERSFKNDSLAVIGVNSLMDNANDAKFMIDDNFDAKKELELYQDADIHDDLKDHLFSRAKNKEHFQSLVGYYKEQSAYQRELERQGFGTQILLGLLPEATNAPIYIGAAAMLPQTAALMGSSALLRFATSGTAGVAIEGLKDVVGEQDKHALDYAGAALFDGAMGAAFGKRTNNFTGLANTMVLKSHGITKDVMAQVKATANVDEKKKIIQDAYFKFSGEKGNKTLIDALDSNVEYANKNIIQKSWESVRHDLAYVTGESPSKTMREFSQKMFPDATLQNLDMNNPDLSTQRDLLEETMRNEKRKIFSPLTKEYVRIVHNSKGGFFGIRPSGQQEIEFSNLLGEIQRERALFGSDIDHAINRVLNDRKMSVEDNAELVDVLKRGSKGMEDLSMSYHGTLAKNGHTDFADGLIQEDGTYMPFIYNKEAISTLLNKGLKGGQIAEFFKQSIKNNIPEIDDDALNAVAMAFYQAVSEQNVKRLNTFDSILDEIASSDKFTDQAREAIAKIKKSKYSRAGDDKAQFANQRTNLDYGHTQKFPINNGTEEVEISFRDFLSTDYLNNMDTYVRKMSGATVLRKHGWDIDARMKDADALDPDDFKSHGEYLKAYNEIKKRNNLVETELRTRIEDEPELRALREQIDEIRSKQTDEGLELLRTIGLKIADNVDPKIQKSIEDALNRNDYQAAADIIFDAVGAVDAEDTTKFFQLMDEFISTPNEKASKLSRLFDEKFDAKLQEAINLEYEPTKFRLETKGDYDTFRNKVREELEHAVQSKQITSTEANKELVRLDTIMKDMTGVATSVDPAGNLNRFYRISHSYNIGRLLGQTFFTMPAEAMNVMWDMGMRSFIESMPSMKSLLRAYKSGVIDNPQTREISDALGMYDEFLSSPRLYEFDHDFNAATDIYTKTGRAVDKIEKWGENFAEFTLMTGGIKPLTAWFQTAHVMGVFKRMKAVANGKAPDAEYRKLIKELGISEEFEDRIYGNIREHAKDGLMNFDKWGHETKNVFLMGVKRRTDTLVQMQRLGDKPAWVVGNQDYMLKDTFTGKVVMELKQFVMTAYVKQLGRALNRKDQYMIGLIASQMTSLTLAYMAKQTLNYAGNQEKFDRAMKTENIIAGTMSMMPQGSVLPMVMNFGSNLMFGQSILGTSRHNSYATDAISSLAMMDGISKVMEAFSIPAEVLSGEADKKTLKPVAGLTGVSNHWLTKALYESTQSK